MTLSLLRIFSHTMGLVGLALLFPLGAAFYYGEKGTPFAFALPLVLSVLMAWWCSRVKRAHEEQLGTRHAFVAVGGVWLTVCLFGAVPLWLSGAFPSWADAVFESVSGFTTTGATVKADVEALPVSVNVWRCTMHWLGGMGVIALIVAIVPLMGTGGSRLIKAESSGSEKGKLTARTTNTAKVLWFLYCGITLVLTLLLRVNGLGWVDALCHAFSIVATGGFSTRNASIAAFGNSAVEWICTVFMLLCSVNFALYYHLLTGRVSEVFRDSELRAFLLIVVCAVFGIAWSVMPVFPTSGEVIRHAAFQTASVLSTTGFMTSDFAVWPVPAQILLLALLLIGGCSGSTSGGIKVVRWSVMMKQAVNEFRRLLHPHGVYTVWLNGQPGREVLVPGVAAFVCAYFLLVLLTALLGACAGLTPFEALSGGLSMMGNVGPAFGQIGPAGNYGALPDWLKGWYSFIMLTGRLEIYTMLILVGNLFFWRRRTAA